jgi:glycosyltransferase involved in cell wall biosynthesis
MDLKVGYFGPFNPRHDRSRVIIKGLRKNGVEVIECNAQSTLRLLRYVKILERQRKLHYDVIILGARGEYYGQPLVPLIRAITKQPIVFDAVLTLYETEVVDRQIVDRKSVKARALYLLDYYAFKNSDLILADTYVHAKYYSQFYHIEPDKFRKLPVGSDDDVFYPRIMKKEKDYFLVMFWGGFAPLHGVSYIVKAAKILASYRDIRFELRGYGQTYKEASALARSLNVENVTFVPKWVPYEKFPNYVAKADVCLGIFGETEKAQRVIPAKVVESLAMQKPLITGDSLAAREILVNMENSLLVPMANPEALAVAILTLKEDQKLREKIAENGYRLFKERLSPKAIGRELKSILLKLVEENN